MRALLAIAAALALALPAAAHLQQRGIPLSELAASSPLALIGTVAGVEHTPSGPVTELVVERAVVGELDAPKLSFSTAGHHPPRYEVGSRVLVFLSTTAPPHASRQSQADRVVLPESASAQAALLSAVEAWAGLVRVAPAERVARLVALSLDQLTSPSKRIRSEVLLDLQTLAARGALADPDVARLTALAAGPAAHHTLAPGLVMVLAALPAPRAPLSQLIESALSPQTRALASRALAGRRTTH